MRLIDQQKTTNGTPFAIHLTLEQVRAGIDDETAEKLQKALNLEPLYDELARLILECSQSDASEAA